jgi:hypothetical protein
MDFSVLVDLSPGHIAAWLIDCAKAGTVAGICLRLALEAVGKQFFK